MVTKARVLLVGLDPDIVDYSKSPVPGLTAATVRAAVEVDKAKLETLGYSVTSLYVDDGKTAESALTAELTSSQYDCIMVGAGLRIVPPYFLLFEKLINVVHRTAPASTKVCFNTNPSDTADAVLRWVDGRLSAPTVARQMRCAGLTFCYIGRLQKCRDRRRRSGNCRTSRR
jgi:hypothetical protein